MKVTDTPIAGLQLLEFASHADTRGRFERVFCAGSLSSAGANLRVAQANLSTTIGRGSLRGLHFQAAPGLEAKLVRCLSGRVFDVAVDLRKGSSTFLRWHAVELSEDRPQAFYLPVGFAHGFQVLSNQAQLLYFHGAPWDAACEGGLRYDDPALSIDWPLPVASMSERDRSHPLIAPDFTGIQT